MREIKFRAWDKTRNKMHFDYTFDITTADRDDVDFEVRHVVFNGSLFKITKASWGTNDDEPEFVSHDFVLMQYTGLKDKNGVEIWEGDIVRTDNGVAQVTFNSWSFSITRDGQETSQDYFPEDHRRYIRSCEVIGNIYQNKELLK